MNQMYQYIKSIKSIKYIKSKQKYILSIFCWKRVFKLYTFTTYDEFFRHNKNNFSLKLQIQYAFLETTLNFEHFRKISPIKLKYF